MGTVEGAGRAMTEERRQTTIGEDHTRKRKQAEIAREQRQQGDGEQVEIVFTFRIHTAKVCALLERYEV